MRGALPLHPVYTFRVEDINYIHTCNPKAIYVKKYNYQCTLRTKPTEEEWHQEGEENEKQDEKEENRRLCEVCG